MTFEEWVLEERKRRGKFSMRDVAAEVGIPLASAQRCLEPAAGRTLGLALLLEARTGGKVEPYTLLPMEERIAIYGPTGCPTKKKGGAA